MFLEISQSSQENTCARASFLIKMQAWDLQLYLKRDSGTGAFLWILWNFLGITFTEHLRAPVSGLVKWCLNSDLYVIPKTSGTALLETTVF